MIKPRPKTTSRYQRPWELLTEEEKAATRAREEKNALKGHFLSRIGQRSFGCGLCLTVYSTARTQRDAEASHAMHLNAVEDVLKGRTTPEWLT
jgi:hypothetical protein